MKRRGLFWFLTAAGILGAGLAGLLVTEQFVREAYVKKGIIFAEARQRYIRLRENTPGAALTSHVKIDGVERDIVMRADENGYIEPSAVHAHPDLKLVFFGGSTVQSINVDEKLRFPYLVGRRLEESLGLKVNSYNAAYLGNNSMHSNDILINKVVPLKPDFAIMMHNVNDLSLSTDYWKKDENFEYGLIGQFEELPGVPRSLGGILKMIKDATFPYTYNLIRTTLTSKKDFYDPQDVKPLVGHPRRKGQTKPLSAYDLDATAREQTDRFSRSLRLFVAASRIFGIQPVLMTQPSSGTLIPGSSQQNRAIHERFEDMHAVFNQVIREVAAAEGVFMVDLEAALDAQPRQVELFYDFVHYNEEGSVFIADVITERLARHIRERASVARPTMP